MLLPIGSSIKEGHTTFLVFSPKIKIPIKEKESAEKCRVKEK